MGVEEAHAAWASAARPVLIETARSYRSVVTHKELAEAVQERSGIHTEQRVHYWIDDILALVSRDNADRDEPLLSALCVNREGSVGTAYGALVLELTGETPADPDDHAAKQRLACHRFFEAPDLPDGGGSSALVPQLANARTRIRKAAVAAASGADLPHLLHGAAAHRRLRHLRLTVAGGLSARVSRLPHLVGHDARHGESGLPLVGQHRPLGGLRERRRRP